MTGRRRGRGDRLAGPACVAADRWEYWHAEASARLGRRLRHGGELSPAEVAAVVAGALPEAIGRWLLARLRARGWLDEHTRIPFDIFEAESCPPEFSGPQREVVRLAVFGPPGQGRPDYKHREATYQLLCAQIVRESGDLRRLATAATRALSHPDVCRDPVLAAMVRAFISEQEAALRTRERVERQEPADESQLQRPFEGAGGLEFPTRTQLLKAFLNLQKDFEVHLAEYNEAAARYALEKMQELARRFPVHIDRQTVARHAQQFDEFLRRCAMYRQQVEGVARQACGAARAGDQKTAAWLVRRLRAIHALTPVLLSAERFQALQREIEAFGQQHEHRVALRELIAREREVAERLKKAAAAIYRFHRLARQQPADAEELKRAEAAYQEAVAEVRTYDTEWLTGLLLELESYLEDLNDPEGRAQVQLDRFIGTVRSALTQLRREIRTVQADRGVTQPDPEPVQPPPARDGASAPPP